MPDNAAFQVFRFQDAFPVRIADRNGDPWFVAADVCKALEISNSRDAVASVIETLEAVQSYVEQRLVPRTGGSLKERLDEAKQLLAEINSHITQNQ